MTFYVFSRILNLQIHAHIYRSFIRHHKMLGVRIAKRKIEPKKPANPCGTRLCSCIFFVNALQKRCNLKGLRRFFFLLIKQISQLLSCQTPAWHHQLISNRFLYFPISGTLLALCIVYLAVLFFQSTSANKRRGSTSRSTRTVNPKLGFLGLFGFAGFLGFWTYRVDQTIFPFVFFVFFGFFGFFYEGKMSNTLIDERYKENKMRAQSTANKTALSIIFLQY